MAKKQKNKKISNKDTNLICAKIISRIKAFITDMFMIMMPIMYITTYIIMSGKDDFQSSPLARWLTMILFGIIIILFWKFRGQTPGFKAYNIKLIDIKTKQNISFFKALVRYVLFIVSAVSIVGFILPFFRKDKKTFQDLMTNSCVIQSQNIS
jgi:uncharacterized RDD family membrane protein YckC